MTGATPDATTAEPMKSLPDEVVVRIKKARAASLVLLWVSMTALCIWLAIASFEADIKLIRDLGPIGSVGAAFFGLCSVLGIIPLFSRRPALVLDRDGIIDRASYAGVGRILWHEVSGLRTVSVRKTRLLIIDLHDPQPFLDRGNPLQRLLRAGTMGVFDSPVALSAVSLGVDFDQFRANVSGFFGRATVRPESERIRTHPASPDGDGPMPWPSPGASTV